MKYFPRFPLIALAAVLALTGCATLNNLTNTQVVVANQVLTLGAELYIQKAGGTAVPPALFSVAQQARAQQLKSFAVEINGFASGTVPLTQLDGVLAGWIAKAKTPLEQGLRQALIFEVDQLLATKITSGALNAAATAIVSEISADWITAATAYGAV
jgi:hypothetical protein